MLFVRIYRIFFGLLSLTALIVQFAASWNYFADFFSYFTILSNILALILFLYLSLSFSQKNKKLQHNVDIFRGAVTLYMSITGIVYWSLLRNNPNLAAYPWINIVAHGVMPIVVFCDWVIAPPVTKLRMQTVGLWLTFPLLYVAYSLIRGSLMGWYPYFFVNPAKVGGYVGVLKYLLFILFGSGILGGLLLKIAKFRRQ